MDNRFLRTEMLIGKENLDKLRKSRVAVFGIGGVGGYACEALARCGIGSFLLVDSDNYNDPDLSLMRAKEYNSVNGNEVRYAYGSKSTFRMERTPNALMSSTAENNFFGECFHI